MIRSADHVTFAVRDPEAAIAFFAHLGFENAHDTVIDGGEPAAFMGDPSMKARHVTLELVGSSPSFHLRTSVNVRSSKGPTLRNFSPSK